MMKELATYFLIVENSCRSNEDTQNDVDIDVNEYLHRAETFKNAMSDLLLRLRMLDNENDCPQDEDVQYHFYEIAKQYYGTGKKEIRNFFRDVYLFTWETANGTRMGTFVCLIGIDRYIDMTRERLNNPLWF